MYFGDDHIGLFRKFPGQYRQTCGRYDPRVRPWCKCSRSLCVFC